MRKNGEVFYMLGDHLGSTSLTTDSAGQVIAEQRYTAWGETRYESGASQSNYTYTGQYSYTKDFGLHFYNARWYDSTIGRFTSADTIIPEQSQGVQAWDRYAYTNNNPVKYVDPSGHFADPVSLAIAGAAIGFFGNIGFQVVENLVTGKSANVTEAFKAVDWKEACTYGVAGAVAGATYGAINPAATVAGVALASGTAGLASGQAAALFDAGWETTSRAIKGEKPKTTYAHEFLRDAHDAGFFDGKQMAFDFGTGAVLGGTFYGAAKFLTVPRNGIYVTSLARANASIAGKYGAVVIGTSKWAEEETQQFLDKRYEQTQKNNSLGKTIRAR